MHYQFLAVACLMAVVRSRRHLCDDLTLPDCTNSYSYSCFFFQIAAMMSYQFLAVACLMGVVPMVRSRRHLCDDLTLPDCTNGDKADYNPTGENRWETKH